MRVDKNNTPYKFAEVEAKILKTLCVTLHGVTKTSPFEAYMGRKPNTALFNIATSNATVN